MMGKGALVALATLIRLIAAKMDEPISHVKGWVNGLIETAVASLYYLVIHGYQSISPLWTTEIEWTSGSGLGLT